MDEKKDGAYLILKPCPIGGVPITSTEFPDDFKKLRELIERDKAKKPVKKSDIEDEWTAGVYCCPSCGGDLWEFDFCHDCGQRIDWKESDEY